MDQSRTPGERPEPHPIFQQMCDVLSDARQEPIAEPLKAGGTLLQPANDGDLTEADLEEIDRAYGIAKTSGELDQRKVDAGHLVDLDALRRNGGL